MRRSRKPFSRHSRLPGFESLPLRQFHQARSAERGFLTPYNLTLRTHAVPNLHPCALTLAPPRALGRAAGESGAWRALSLFHHGRPVCVRWTYRSRNGPALFLLQEHTGIRTREDQTALLSVCHAALARSGGVRALASTANPCLSARSCLRCLLAVL